MKLLRKVGNLRTNLSEDLFLEITMKLGRKWEILDRFEVKIFLFREHQFLEILIIILPRASNFEYLSRIIIRCKSDKK